MTRYLTKRRLPFRALVILAIGLLIALSPITPTLASPTASLNLSKTVISEGNDFATRELGLPWWNANDEAYPDFFTALKNFNRSIYNTNSNGYWDLHPTNNDPRIWLHWTGVGTTQSVLKMGDSYPIDASKYKLLSYYMCLDNAPSSASGVDENWGANIYWFYDRSPHSDPNNGSTNYLLFKSNGLFKKDGDCELITVDLSKVGTSKGTWNNSPRKPMGLRLDPLNMKQNFEIHWVRLTTIDTSNVVPMNWSGAPAGNLDFYLSRTGCNQKGIQIGTANNTNGGGTFNWGATVQPNGSAGYPYPLPESFEPGSYYVYYKDSNGAAVCSSSQLTIHQAPRVDFQQPGPISGPDFAARVLGNPWDMESSEDVDNFVNIQSSQFQEGILNVTTKQSDPAIYLNVPGTIDTSKYRYVSFRFKVDGENALGDGWVQRFIWWYQGPGFDNVTTQDMEIYEGWHTYTIDLKTAPMENCSSNCWSGFPTVFRFDPYETPDLTTMHLDFITLTGVNTIDRGDTYTIYYTQAATGNPDVSFFYDTDRIESNGRSPIAIYREPDTRSGLEFLSTFNIFLPINRIPGGIDFFSQSLSTKWDTSSVPTGTYYISAVINDGVMSTTWYSELPVTLK